MGKEIEIKMMRLTYSGQKAKYKFFLHDVFGRRVKS